MKTITELLFAATIIGLTPTAFAGVAVFPTAANVSEAQPGHFSIDGLDALQLSGDVSLPVQNLLVPLYDGENAEMIRVEASSRFTQSNTTKSPTPDFTPTSSDGQYSDVRSSIEDLIDPTNRLFSVSGEIEIDGQRYAELMLFPVTIDSEGIVRHHSDFTFSVQDRVVAISDIYDRKTMLAETVARSTRSATTGNPDTYDYLIITSEQLSGAFDRFVQHKTETGFKVRVTTLEQVVAEYPATDDPESIRECLKAFYTDGGRYVLLGGDETVVPVRYAYHLNAYSTPELIQLQICDLYYADLTGEWDVDGDNVWGEPYHDSPDIVPELIVGRLPVDTPEEIAAYTRNLITYETSPGHGDPEYLARLFFFSADQLRDGDQHGTISKTVPGGIVIDTVTGVESASGDDPSPTNTPVIDLKEPMADGFGFVNIMAHGRVDGFVAKSSGYYDWPKELLLTEAQSGVHGSVDSLIDPARPSFYYSIACDNGGFDLDNDPGAEHDANIAAHLIAKEGGAVGMIAYSRWGWVESSYRVQKSFYEHLFADSALSAAEAMYNSKVDNYYFRDLVYGQNYFGDPSLGVYRGRPEQATLTPMISGDIIDITVTADGRPAASCRVVLSDSTGILTDTVTNADGQLSISYPCDQQRLYRLAVMRSGMTTTIVSFIGSLVTGVEDDEQSLPIDFALEQNYPNPFNPSTKIAFSLPSAETIRLELFNSLGQAVAVLADGMRRAGHHEIEWHGTDQAGRRVGSGVYFYRLSTESSSATRKMLLLK